MKKQKKSREIVMDFKEIFDAVLSYTQHLKVIYVATADKSGKPNCAPKMLVSVEKPNKIFFIDYRFTRSHSNLSSNSKISVSFMHDKSFTGYRLTGNSVILCSGPEFQKASRQWFKKQISYEASRMVDRIKGNYSERNAENALPKDFCILKMTAKEASIVKPDRILRGTRS